MKTAQEKIELFRKKTTETKHTVGSAYNLIHELFDETKEGAEGFYKVCNKDENFLFNH